MFYIKTLQPKTLLKVILKHHGFHQGLLVGSFFPIKLMFNGTNVYGWVDWDATTSIEVMDCLWLGYVVWFVSEVWVCLGTLVYAVVWVWACLGPLICVVVWVFAWLGTVVWVVIG